MTSRRGFVGSALGVIPLMAGATLKAQQDGVSPTAPDTGAAERLRAPEFAGRPRDPLTAFDNDPGVIAIERRLKCTCGCTLDIYTCRTTDFTCTFSPELHKEIVAMVQDGRTPEQIIDAFVAREGESMLMAPPPDGFNVAGYVVPGLSVMAASLLLAAYLSRRRRVVAADAASTAVGVAQPVAPSDAQLASLRRALDDVES